MDKIVMTFIETNNRYVDFIKSLEETKRVFGTVELYPSEIHTLVYIREHPGYNFTDIAKGMDITKGALYKLINKLVKKALLTKYYKSGNKKSIYFNMTDEGEEACQAHEDFHKNIRIELPDDMVSFLKKNDSVLQTFFKYTNQVIDSVEKKIKQFT